jgi:hypothetical protein
MTDKELAARVLLVMRSAQDKALRTRFSGRREGGHDPTPESVLEEAVAELGEADRASLETNVDSLIDILRR